MLDLDVDCCLCSHHFKDLGGLRAGSWYMQMPVKPTCSPLAPVGHPPKRHERAQYLSPEEESCKMHCGFAVVPAGTSVGHVIPSHLGVQVEPERPWTCTSTSSDLQGGFS